MDISRASSVLNSIDLTKPSSPRHRASRVSKPKSTRSPHASHPTIQYFRSISKRRIHTPEPEINPGSTTYLPYSRAALLRRIQTYQSSSNWSVSYGKLTPVLSARHGWICGLDNELRCETCSARLSIKFPKVSGGKEEEEDFESNLQDSIKEKLSDKYVEELIRSHHKSCPWVAKWSPKSIYEIKMDLSELDVLKKRIQESSVSDKLKDVSIVDVPGIETLHKWCTENAIASNSSIVPISLLGWSLSMVGRSVLFHCASCGRRFFPDDEPVDIINEHNDWCCYKGGYRNVLELVKTLSKWVPPVDEPVCENDENEEEEGGESDGKESVEDTLKRLNELRKSYF